MEYAVKWSLQVVPWSSLNSKEDGDVGQIYRVRSGDTLGRIAEFHGTSLDDLLQLNPQIENPDLIRVGDTLNVPDTPEDGASIHAELAEGDGPLWYRIALREMHTGVDEIRGDDHTPRIIEYHAATSLSATTDETPWCSSFVNWCMMKSGEDRTNSAAARSWLRWGSPLDDPQLGCVVIFSRPPNPSSGHVAFFVRSEARRVWVLGGNQSNQVNIASYPEDRLLGYRWTT